MPDGDQEGRDPIDRIAPFCSAFGAGAFALPSIDLA
jgi:hypothetical protein